MVVMVHESYDGSSVVSNLVVALNNAMEQWSYFNCNVVKGGTLTITGVDQ